MEKSNEKDVLSLTHFFSKALFMGIGLSKIMITAKESAIFSIILGTILGYFLLKIILNINYNNRLINKIIMFIILYTLFIIGIAEYVNLISNIYLIDTDKFFIILPLIIIIFYMNSKELNVHFKVSYLLFAIFILLYLISILSLTTEVRPLNLLPLFNTNIKKILLCSLEFALYSVTPNILYGNFIKNYKNIQKKIAKRYLISCFSIMLIAILTQGILGIELIKLFKYPEYVILKKISILDFINNIENLLSFFWIFIIFMYLSICSKELCMIVKDLLKNKYIYPIFMIISLYFITKYIFENINYLLLLYNYLWIICLIILIIYVLINLKKEK